uniref:Uncharacterized protein n=1 Tax=Rhizophora mucronata TaxID=61149 RepID=A0A2P2QLJ9_RHIMU
MMIMVRQDIFVTSIYSTAAIFALKNRILIVEIPFNPSPPPTFSFWFFFLMGFSKLIFVY